MTESTPQAAPAALFQSERQREIVTLVGQDFRVEVADLADRFGVTTETIRRDLSELQDQQVLRRVHGGAVGWDVADFEPLVAVRNDQHDDEKRRLASRALSEMPASGSIIIDSGSTLLRLAEAIRPGRHLQVVTNSLPIAQVLVKQSDLEVIVAGGSVNRNTLAMVDPQAIATIEPLQVDTLFISSDGASPTRGLTTPYRDEAALKRTMIQAARRVVSLIDHSKFGPDHLIRFADWTDIDVLVTNSEVPREVVAAIEGQGVTVLLA